LIIQHFNRDQNTQVLKLARTFGGSHNEGFFAITETNDNGIVMAGFTESFSSNQSDDVYLVKTDFLGNPV